MFLSLVLHSSIRCPFLRQYLQNVGLFDDVELSAFGLGGGVRDMQLVVDPTLLGCMMILMSADGSRWRSV